MTRHIRAVDPNNVILGDRHSGNKGIPAVLTAMKHLTRGMSPIRT